MNIEQLKTETNVDFLRQAAVLLFDSNLKLLDDNKRLRNQQSQTEQDRLALEDKLHVLRKKFFGDSSERSPRSDRPVPTQSSLLIHNQVPEEIKDLIPLTTKDLPEEACEHALEKQACAHCNSENIRPMKGQFEESAEVIVTERVYKKIIHKRQKYTCGDCGNITTAPGSDKLIPGLGYSTDFIAQVASDKFNFHIPLERQRRQMESAGLIVGTKTLWGLTAVLADYLMPLTGKIRSEILAQKVIHMDESPMKTLSTNTNGYVWVLSNNHGCYYRYETTRSGKVAQEMIAGYEGTLLTDGYVGYNPLKKAIRDGPNIKRAYCWAHVRRKFLDAQENQPEAKAGVDFINELYAVEHKVGTLEQLKDLRNTESSKIIKRFKTWINETQNQIFPSSSLGQAFAYTNSLWSGLTLFLTDENIPLDNNSAERALRSPVMGRNNYQGFRTIDGADVAMTYFTLIDSCKILQLNPVHYIREMAHRAAQREKLLTPYKYAVWLKITNNYNSFQK